VAERLKRSFFPEALEDLSIIAAEAAEDDVAPSDADGFAITLVRCMCGARGDSKRNLDVIIPWAAVVHIEPVKRSAVSPALRAREPDRSSEPSVLETGFGPLK
jgi:hypothetical protein